jgi:hypothetical protein
MRRAKAKAVWTPNQETYAPSMKLFAFSKALCEILRRLLGDPWKVGYKPEMGLRDPFDGRPAVVTTELRAGDAVEEQLDGAPGSWSNLHARSP